MQDIEDIQSLEVVALTDGGFALRRIGAVDMTADEERFATRAEAEAALFDRAERLEGEPGVLKPGFGQGLP